MNKQGCPYCKNEISPLALKCGYCQEWLALGKWNYRNPTISYFLIGFTAFITTLSFNACDRFTSSETPKKEIQKFIKGSSKIIILSDKLIRNGKRLYISENVRNDEKVNWDNVYVTANFYSKAGEKVERSYDLIHIKAGEIQSYQVEFFQYEKSDPQLYDNYKLEITAASNYGR